MHQALVDSVKTSMVLIPLLRNNGASSSKFVDMTGWDNVDFLIQLGATDTTVAVKAQESDNADGSSPGDITGAAVTQLTATDDNKLVVLSVKRDSISKRYVGVVVTIGNGAAGADVAVVAARYGGNGVTLPVTQEAAGANAYATAEVVRA